MKRWKRTAAVGSAVLTLATAGVVVASATPAGSLALRAAGHAITSALSGVRPVVDANAGAGGGSGANFPPLVVTVGPKARLTSKLTIDVNVSITCGPVLEENYSFANVELSEAAGHTVANAYGGRSSFPCDGNTYTFVVTTQAQNVPFRPGSGIANVYAQMCGADSLGNFGCEDANTTSAVSIKK